MIIIIITTLLILLCLLIIAAVAIAVFYIQNSNVVEEDVKKTVDGNGNINNNGNNNVVIPPPVDVNNINNINNNNINNVNNNVSNSLFLKYSNNDKESQEIMNYFQEIITELQNEGCAHAMAIFDLEKFSIEIRKNYSNRVMSCEEAIAELKVAFIIPDNVYYVKTQNTINLLIEKIVAAMCLNGNLNAEKVINLVVMMKNTVCNNDYYNINYYDINNNNKNSLFLKYSKYNKDSQEIMNYFQEIITELQNEGCAHAMAIFDLEKFSSELRKSGEVLTCEEAIKDLKDILIIPDNIYYVRTQTRINLLIEKIVDAMCLDGKMDVEKIINLVLMMKNTVCYMNEV